VGAFLSSGVDSTAVVALAREVDPEIEVFTVGFEHAGYSLLPAQRLPGGALRLLDRLAQHLPEGVPGRSYLHRAALDLSERYFGNARMFDLAECQALLGGPPEAHHQQLTGPVYARTAHLDDATRMQAVDLETWLPGGHPDQADNSRKVWTGLMFCLWYAVFVDRTLTPVPEHVPARSRRLADTAREEPG